MSVKLLAKSFLISWLVIGCSKHREYRGEKRTSGSNNESIPPFKNENCDLEIDINELISQSDFITTTFLLKSKSEIYPERNGMLSVYLLNTTDSVENKIRRSGRLVVFDSLNKYDFEKSSLEFLDITLLDSGLSFFGEEIFVGQKIARVKDVLGDDFQETGNLILYRQKNITTILKIEDGIIIKARTAKFRKDVDIYKILKLF